MHVYSTHTRPSLVKVVCLCNSVKKILQTNSHLPAAHQCQTRLKNKLCTLLWVCRSRDNRLCQSLTQLTVARKMTRCSTRVCKRTLELSTVRTHQPMRKQGSKGKPLFSVSFLLPFAWFSTKHDWRHWRKKKCSINSRYDCDLMSTGRKEIVDTFQSEVRFLYWRLGGKISKPWNHRSHRRRHLGLDFWTRIKVKLLPLESWKLGEHTVNL